MGISCCRRNLRHVIVIHTFLLSLKQQMHVMLITVYREKIWHMALPRSEYMAKCGNAKKSRYAANSGNTKIWASANAMTRVNGSILQNASKPNK